MPLFITLVVLLVPTYFLASKVKIPKRLADQLDLEPLEDIDGE